MKIKLDENLPVSLARGLETLGHDVDTVHEEDLEGEGDGTIWRAAQREKRFLITQDLDFSDIRKFAPGTHEGLLLVRLRDPGRQALAELVLGVSTSMPAEDWKGCFVVATERKIRLLRPASSSTP